MAVNRLPKATSAAQPEREVLAAKLVRQLPGAELSWKFGNASLVIDDKVFAFSNRKSDGMVMKLPEADIATLVEEGNARPLVMGKRTMREWLVVENPESAATLRLLRRAMAFVGSLPKAKRSRPARKTAEKKKAAR